MPCPTVTTRGGKPSFSSDTVEGAISQATELAMFAATLVCQVNGGECSGVNPVPVHTELIELVSFENDEGNVRYRAVVKCTFNCTKGCWPFGKPEEEPKPESEKPNYEWIERESKPPSDI